MNVSFFSLHLLFFGFYGLVHAKHFIEIFVHIEILVIGLFLMTMESISIHPDAHRILGSSALSILILCGAELALGLSFLMNCFKNSMSLSVDRLTEFQEEGK